MALPAHWLTGYDRRSMFIAMDNTLMKNTTLAFLAAGAILLSGCNKTADTGSTPPKLDSQEQKVSYIIGSDVGGNFKNNDISIDEQAFIAGVRDALKGNKPALSEEDIKTTMTAFSETMKKKAEAKQATQKVEMEKKGKENAEAEKAFLAKNGARKEVTTTKSGLQYEVVTMGKGKKPTAADTVTVHYSGKLLDGTEFDSSYKRNEPAVFPVNGVIPGWTEALQLMPEGSKFKIYIPSALAYGPGGTGPIGPNAALVFDVELIKVGAPEQSKAAQPAQ